MYQKIPPIILSNITDKPKSTSEDNKISRKSILLQCSTSFEYQRISYGTIKEVYTATQKITNQNEVSIQDVIIIINSLYIMLHFIISHISEIEKIDFIK